VAGLVIRGGIQGLCNPLILLGGDISRRLDLLRWIDEEQGENLAVTRFLLVNEGERRNAVLGGGARWYRLASRWVSATATYLIVIGEADAASFLGFDRAQLLHQLVLAEKCVRMRSRNCANNLL